MSVYLDDLFKPIFVTPINLDFTLKLNSGRAWVGFTGATGDNTYQVSQHPRYHVQLADTYPGASGALLFFVLDTTGALTSSSYPNQPRPPPSMLGQEHPTP